MKSIFSQEQWRRVWGVFVAVKTVNVGDRICLSSGSAFTIVRF